MYITGLQLHTILIPNQYRLGYSNNLALQIHSSLLRQDSSQRLQKHRFSKMLRYHQFKETGSDRMAKIVPSHTFPLALVHKLQRSDVQMAKTRGGFPVYPVLTRFVVDRLIVSIPEQSRLWRY